jgi:hypothetical protein
MYRSTHTPSLAALAAPVLLALALRADEAVGQTDDAAYDACIQSKCPCTTGLQWPNGWREQSAQDDVNKVRNNAYVAAAVKCMCNYCGEYDKLNGQNWPARMERVCEIANEVVADKSTKNQVVLRYYPDSDSTCAGDLTKVQTFYDGLCFDRMKFSCSAAGNTYDYEIYGEGNSDCQGRGIDGSVFAVSTPGCYPTKDPNAQGQHNSVECFGPAYKNSDMTCGAPTCIKDTCASAGTAYGWTFKGGKAPDGCMDCTVGTDRVFPPESCAELITAVTWSGCLGQCGWGWSDETLDEIVSKFSGAAACSDGDKEELKKALKESESKHTPVDDDAASTTAAGLSILAAAAAVTTAAAAVVW